MQEVYLETCQRDESIRDAGYNLITIWEHEINDMMQVNAKVKKFFNNCVQTERLIIRNAFFGARTQTYRMYAESDIQKCQTIEHLDVVSMYPYILCNTPMPLGSPKVITDRSEMKPIENYKGFFLIDVIPPKQLLYPILGVRMHRKLIFPLCRTCAKGKNTKNCSHSDAISMEFTFTRN